jgi:hypothetical protein
MDDWIIWLLELLWWGDPFCVWKWMSTLMVVLHRNCSEVVLTFGNSVGCSLYWFASCFFALIFFYSVRSPPQYSVRTGGKWICSTLSFHFPMFVFTERVILNKRNVYLNLYKRKVDIKSCRIEISVSVNPDVSLLGPIRNAET